MEQKHTTGHEYQVSEAEYQEIKKKTLRCK